MTEDLKPKTYYSSSRPEIIKFLPDSFQSLLDVGCSQGGFGASVLSRHPAAEVWGVEPHRPAFEIASQRLTKVIHGPFSDSAAIPDDYFDVVTFNDSLEHMLDEFEALRIARKKLRSNGTLICSVPNVRYFENMRGLLINKDWEYVDAGILDRTHLRFFTERSFRRTLERSGFKVEQIKGINSHWWSGWKIGILKLVFGRHIEDMRWTQFVATARKIEVGISEPTLAEADRSTSRS